MKRLLLSLCMILAISQMSIAQKYFDKVKIASTEDSVTYSLGYILAQNLIKEGFSEFDPTILAKGFKDAKEASPMIASEQAGKVIQSFFAAKEEENKQAALAKEKEFMDANAKKPGVVTTESGLQYKVVKEGTGKTPTDTNMVKVHYEGKLLDGTVFDSTFDSEEPAELQMDYLIPGMTEGLKLMKEGAEYIFYIPSELGYGEYSPSEEFPAYSTLIFDLELISVEPMKDDVEDEAGE